ncbi:MAG: NAD(P) transhydrogenase subunit alpha [Candidatus Eremiobacter antarcticus]|nr:NAD(P) transhydrogenase subunit alpha [Candidatus Eremiobacteraeota bacterium]MBC5808623.1 NAD(P) transhydrogenase subunit alpha [Candidatus Eremiobacteraeota bacterium]
MNEKLLVELTVFVLSVFVGFEVISKVPSMLHTPLMSATNAIHGIVVVGAMLVAGAAIGGPAGRAIGIAAMILATINVVGGFAVTGRMLQMFKAKPSDAPAGDARR